MEIIRMTSEHVEAVAELEKLCFSDPWSLSSISSEVSNPLSLWLVAVCDGSLAGYIGSQAVLDGADVMNIAVAPDRRGQGIGKELIHSLIMRLKSEGVVSLMLEVRASNLQAIGLYQSLGFVTVGVRPHYYRNPKEDALIMRKEILNEYPGN